MIDDDQINCQMPHSALAEVSSTSTYAVALVKLAQMASLISKRLTCIETLQQSADHLVKAVVELNQRLMELETYLQQLVDLASPLEPGKPGAGLDLQQAMYIRMAYYITVLDIHTPLTYPWSQQLFNLMSNLHLRDQVQTSSELVIQTARRAIQATQFVRLDGTTSVLQVQTPLLHFCSILTCGNSIGFHGPLYSLINLFIHILQDTQRSTVPSDLALLEIGASHFLRLEFSTNSEMSFPFTKELAVLARSAIDYSNMLSVTLAAGDDIPHKAPGFPLGVGGPDGALDFQKMPDPLRNVGENLT